MERKDELIGGKPGFRKRNEELMTRKDRLTDWWNKVEEGADEWNVQFRIEKK
jgi:hypothetical protein